MSKQIEKKQYARIAVIYAAVFAIYNIIVLLLFSDKNNVFWISYGFMCLGFAAVIASMIKAFKRTRPDGTYAEAIFWGIPLFSFSLFYFFGELFLSFVFMLFRNHASVKLCVALQVIFLLIFVIFAMLALLSRDYSSEVSDTVATNVRAIKTLSVNVAALERACEDAELKKQLHKVEEAIRFSDPMTNSSVSGMDVNIGNLVGELEEQCLAAGTDEASKASAMQTCARLLLEIAKRNDTLRVSK